MVQSVPCTHTLPHTHTHTVILLPSSKSIKLVTYFTPVSTGIYVRDIALSLSKLVVCLFITLFLSLNPSDTHALSSSCLTLLAHKNIQMLPSLQKNQKRTMSMTGQCRHPCVLLMPFHPLISPPHASSYPSDILQ